MSQCFYTNFSNYICISVVLGEDLLKPYSMEFKKKKYWGEERIFFFFKETLHIGSYSSYVLPQETN